MTLELTYPATGRDGVISSTREFFSNLYSSTPVLQYSSNPTRRDYDSRLVFSARPPGAKAGEERGSHEATASV